MMLFEELTDSDKEKIEKYLEYYNGRSGNYGFAPVTPLSKLLRFWEQNKKDLFEMFGHKFILEKEVEFEKGENEIYRDLENKLFDSGNNFIRQYENKLIFNSSLSYEERKHYGDLIDLYSLSKNVYENETFVFVSPKTLKTIKIQQGCKTIKALNKIAEAFCLDGFEEFRIIHSQVLNQKKLKGILCLSIHPLDFLTMSDNASGWSSCMSWQEGGCYRIGTVEMMNSPMVVVAYLKGSSDMEFGDYYWNNKKWRELMIVNDEIITNVLGYPYQNSHLSKLSVNWLRQLVPDELYTKNIETYTVYDISESKELGIKFIVKPETSTMYNDFRDSHFAYYGKKIVEKDPQPFYLSISSYLSTSSDQPINIVQIKFNYSGPYVCMCCGEAYYDYPSEGCLLCSDCEDLVSCYMCGELGSTEDMFLVDGEYYCAYCYENETAEDFITGERHYINNMERIWIAEDESFIFSDPIYISNLEESKIETVELMEKGNWYNNYYQVAFINELPKDFREKVIDSIVKWNVYAFSVCEEDNKN